jgi:hypothetical protein
LLLTQSNFAHYSVHLRKRILQRFIIFVLYALPLHTANFKHAVIGTALFVEQLNNIGVFRHGDLSLL